MPKTKTFTCTQTQKEILTAISKKRTAGGHLHQRSTILLAYNEKRNQLSVARHHDGSIDMVRRWTGRWKDYADELATLENHYTQKRLSHSDYTQAITDILQDERRPGAPRTFTEAQKKKIIALATSKPEDVGIPITHWSHETLMQAVIDHGIVQSISSTHIGRFLKRSNITTTQK